MTLRALTVDVGP